MLRHGVETAQTRLYDGDSDGEVIMRYVSFVVMLRGSPVRKIVHSTRTAKLEKEQEGQRLRSRGLPLIGQGISAVTVTRQMSISFPFLFLVSRRKVAKTIYREQFCCLLLFLITFCVNPLTVPNLDNA